MKIFLVMFLTMVSVVSLREIIVISRCVGTLTVKTQGNAGHAGLGHQQLAGGGAQTSFSFPEGWAGRLWADTDGRGATLFEIAMNQFENLDFYDISLVDGFNHPMLVGPRGGELDLPDCQWIHCRDQFCPEAYHHPLDDLCRKVVFSCRGANYEVTFCP